MKKIISITLTAILALSLAACGSKKADTEPTGEAASLAASEESSVETSSEGTNPEEKEIEIESKAIKEASEGGNVGAGNKTTKKEGKSVKNTNSNTPILNTDSEVANYAISQGIPLGQVSWNEANKTVTFYIFELCKDRSANSAYYGEKMSAEYNAKRVMPTQGTRDAIVFKYINPNTNEYWNIIKETDHYESWDVLYPADPKLNGNLRVDENGNYYDEEGNLVLSGNKGSN